jgi:hypothetical protein
MSTCAFVDKSQQLQQSFATLISTSFFGQQFQQLKKQNVATTAKRNQKGNKL